MLVLPATFYNNLTKHIVPEKPFRRMLKRTIEFLRRLSYISPTCAIDCQILEGTYRVLFDRPLEEKHHHRDEGVVTEPMCMTDSLSGST